MRKPRTSIRTHGVAFLRDREDGGPMLDLHRKTRIEAEEALDAFVNECVMNGAHACQIIHGRSGKVLKQVVERWLARNKGTLIESFEPFAIGFRVRVIEIPMRYQRR